MRNCRFQLLLIYEMLSESFEKIKALQASGAWCNGDATYETLHALRLAKRLVAGEYIRQRDGSLPIGADPEKMICV